MAKKTLRLCCVAACMAVGLAFTGGTTVFASGQVTPNLGAPPHYAVGPAASFVAPALGRGTPTCPSGDGTSHVCYSPAFLQQAYDFPTGRKAPTGAGQTIVVVDPYGSPTIADDLAAFDKAFGIAPASLTIMGPNGSGDQSAGNVQFWGVESSLDVEWAHAMAPGANIVLAVAASEDTYDILAIEAQVLAKYPTAIVAHSFGLDEDIPDPSVQAFIDGMHAMYEASPGATLVASTGDYGATDSYDPEFPSDRVIAAYPASDPLALSVGGTQGKPYPDGVWRRGGYGGESAWNESREGTFYAATGGAPSILFSAPSWQKSFSRNTMRTIPDVAYSASIDGGVVVYYQQTVFTVGGTSAGPPQWAGILALANELRAKKGNAPLGSGANAAMYAIAADRSQYRDDFHDITDGNNILVDQTLGFNAARGYDLATGLGSPDVSNLIEDLARNKGPKHQHGDGDDSGHHNHGNGGDHGRGHGGDGPHGGTRVQAG